MKRLMLLLAFLISIGTSAFGQEGGSTSSTSVIIDLTPSEEGVTKNLATELGDNVNAIINLTIIGPMTEADFTTLKNMSKLQVLDISGVTALPVVESYDVTLPQFQGIPASTFRENSSLQSISFPVCLQTIGNHAFYGCTHLANVSFPEGCQLKIVNPYAFYESRAIISMDFSHCKELISIGEYSFRQSSQLYEVNLKGCSKLELIGTGCFQECKTLEKIDFTGCQSLKSIGKLCFYYTALQNVSLADCIKLESIDDEAFRSVRGFSFSQFEKLSSLKTIGSLTFANTSISGDISFPSSIVSVGANAFEGLALSSVIFPNCTQLQTISVKAFSNCFALQTVQLENCPALSTLHQTAFDGCNGLKAISVSGNNNYESADGVLIDKQTHTLLLYPSSKSATEYTIPDAVTSIVNGSFPYNSSIKRLVIPTTVESIEPGTFANTAFSDGYAIIEMLSSTPLNLTGSIGLEGAKVCVPAGAAELYKLVDYWKDCRIIAPVEGSVEVTLANAGSLLSELSDVVLSSITELTINGPMNASDFEMIKQMTLLTKVDLSGATMEDNRLPSRAFDGLSYLKEVKLPNSIVEIGEYAFYSLDNLEIVNLPENLQVIGKYAFDYCGKMQKIDLSILQYLKTIEYCAFFYCTAIPTNLNLPVSLEYIGGRAFRGTYVTSVDFSKTSLNRIEYDAFDDCIISGSLVFPATLTYIGNNAFEDAKVSSIKLKSPMMVSLGGTDVFNATNKTTCKVYVPKGLGAAYKADTYWSPFGNNIEEYGHLVTVTTNNSAYGTVSGGGAYEEGEQVTVTANPHESVFVDWKEMIPHFAGWYKENQKISSDLVYCFTMGTEDLLIEARFYVDDTNIGGGSIIDDSNKIDGTNVTFGGRLIVDGSLPWNLNRFSFNWVFSSSLLVNSPMSATTIEVKAHPEELAYHWNFISLPYDVKISDIEKPYESSQFVIRYYDGASRAANGTGGSWKQLGENDVMKANQGYIMMPNFGSPDNDVWYTFNSSIDDMNKLFNRQAVTIPLEKHPSNVPADANWNLVGNPFPCYFSVEQLFRDGLDGTVTVWSDDIQNYAYYTQDDADAYLAPLTAFFIQHGGSTSSVTFKPEGRAATLPTTRAAVADLRSEAGREVINLQLANDSLSDKTRVVFNEAASTDYELGKDAAKFSSMNSNAPSLYTLDAQNQQFAINERPVGNGVVRLGCYIGVKGSYTLSAKEALASDLYLYDAETGASCNLRETSYTFTAEAGVCNNRFELRTSLKGTDIAAIEGFSWQVAGNQLQLNGLPIGATISLFDANGRMRFTGDAATAAAGIALPQSGIYYLIIRTAEGVSSTVSIKR